MEKLPVVVLLGAGMLSIAACDKANDGVANNAAEPEITFQSADANNDGRITPQEALTVPGINFDRMDSDKNMVVTPQEFSTAMALTRPRG
jgi:hypothetical protein